MGGVMGLDRESWPLSWTTDLMAGKSLVEAWDLDELRCVIDTLRVANGLVPVSWRSGADGDPTIASGRSVVRIAHLAQTREALAELFEIGELEPPADLAADPTAPKTRRIGLSDLAGPRGWVERFEALRPDLSARVARRYGDYSAPTLADEQHLAAGRLTEMWDPAGLTRYFYNGEGRVSRELRIQDGFEYWTSYGYDRDGRKTSITYPDGESVSFRLGQDARVAPWFSSTRGSLLGRAVRASLTSELALADAIRRSSKALVGFDGRGRAVRIGDPARPVARLAYDGNGRVAKRVDDRGTSHFVSDHYERNLGWGAAVPESVVKYLPLADDGECLMLVNPRASEGAGRPLAPVGGSKTGSGWPLSDELWRAIQPIIGSTSAPSSGECHLSDRQVLDAALYALLLGIALTRIPPSLGPAEQVRERFSQWQRDGTLARLWKAGLADREALSYLDWWALIKPSPAALASSAS